MKVRIIKKPEYHQLHHVQVKRWWWPWWTTVAYDSLTNCYEIYNNLITHGGTYTIVHESTK